MRTLVAVAVLLGLVGAAAGDKPKAKAKAKIGKGFWKILVKPNAVWTLHETIGDNKGVVTVETYDVRKVGKADVARLRWTHILGTQKQDIGSRSGHYTQVAVTEAGLYILDAEMDDKAVAKALAGKPSRSDPPKPYAGTKQNDGRYLTVEDDRVCLGQGPRPGDPECPDTCDATMCISPTDGVVSLMGNWAPGVSAYAQDGYDPF